MKFNISTGKKHWQYLNMSINIIKAARDFYMAYFLTNTKFGMTTFQLTIQTCSQSRINLILKSFIFLNSNIWHSTQINIYTKYTKSDHSSLKVSIDHSDWQQQSRLWGRSFLYWLLQILLLKMLGDQTWDLHVNYMFYD